MTGAFFIMFFLLCGPFEMFCEQGRIIQPSCAASEAWLRAGLRSDQSLLIMDCRPYEPAEADDD
ncbi:MAG: hypothetical protein INF97_04115 [Roseomonas sp.]|nr:hypothetical protein [Roseomonas sp.]